MTDVTGSMISVSLDTMGHGFEKKFTFSYSTSTVAVIAPFHSITSNLHKCISSNISCTEPTLVKQYLTAWNDLTLMFDD